VGKRGGGGVRKDFQAVSLLVQATGAVGTITVLLAERIGQLR
jgi:hypothetical protein